MDWQLTLTFLTIGLASGFILRRCWLTWRASKSGCAGGCGCAKASTIEPPKSAVIPVEQLVLRQRKN